GFYRSLGTARSPASSNTRKKTSGTLYSVFKEPDPRGLLPTDERRPTGVASYRISVFGRNFQLVDFPRCVNSLDATALNAATLLRPEVEKEPRTLAGMRNIGAAASPVKLFRGKL